MNTEEKAKAFDEALERFHQFKEKYYSKKTHFGDVLFDKTGEMQKDFDSIFPQLAESEDERIRKWIFDLVNNMSFENLTKSEGAKNEEWKKKVLAYLEKQKEQKPVECIEDSVKFEEGFKDGRESGLRDGQKYVLDNLDSYGLCKPSEWSEEDEKALERAIDCVRSWEIDYCDGDNRTSERLKSLRPYWKPSEKQMKALDNARFCKAYDRTELDSLYEQLKKL